LVAGVLVGHGLWLAQQHGGLGHVRGDQVDEGQERLAECRDRLKIEQDVPAARHHDGVEHDGTGAGSGAARQPTASITSAVPSIPILTASMRTSSNRLSSWAVTNSPGTGWIPATPCVFWAVSAVTTVVP